MQLILKMPKTNQTNFPIEVIIFCLKLFKSCGYPVLNMLQFVVILETLLVSNNHNKIISFNLIMTEFLFEQFCNCAMDHCEVAVQYTSVHRCVKLINIVIKQIFVNFFIDNLKPYSGINLHAFCQEFRLILEPTFSLIFFFQLWLVEGTEIVYLIDFY